jgi:hypothetical protein
MNQSSSGAAAGTATVHTAQPRTVRVVECGRIARLVLREGATGIAHAVFRRSAYLECTAQRLVCIGDASLGRGPLNARVEGFSPPRPGEMLGLTMNGATLWTPPNRTGRPVRAALRALRAAAAQRPPVEGLGGVVAGRSSPLIEHARPAMAALDRWLVGALPAAELEGLIGLGPGLTPSGDDYLGGALIALRAFQRAEQADALWAWAAPRLPQRTNRISAAHLSAAAEGEGQEALHDCLEGLIQGAIAGWRERLARVDAIGHCSGWDGLAGVIAVAQQCAR